MSTSKGWGELNDMLQVVHGTLSIKVIAISFRSSIVLRQSVNSLEEVSFELSLKDGKDFRKLRSGR